MTNYRTHWREDRREGDALLNSARCGAHLNALMFHTTKDIHAVTCRKCRALASRDAQRGAISAARFNLARSVATAARGFVSDGGDAAALDESCIAWLLARGFSVSKGAV